MDNDLAIVPYNERRQQTEGRVNGGEKEKVAKHDAIVLPDVGSIETGGVSKVLEECNAFDMIKLGKCNEFKALVEVRKAGDDYAFFCFSFSQPPHPFVLSTPL